MGDCMLSTLLAFRSGSDARLESEAHQPAVRLRPLQEGDVFGGLFLAHFGANGQASTTLDLSGNNFLKIIDDVNGDSFGMLMNFSPRPWRMTLNCWFTTSGLILALVGNKNRFWQYKHFLKNMGMSGWIVVSMDVAMVWLMHNKTFCERNGW